MSALIIDAPGTTLILIKYIEEYNLRQSPFFILEFVFRICERENCRLIYEKIFVD